MKHKKKCALEVIKTLGPQGSFVSRAWTSHPPVNGAEEVAPSGKCGDRLCPNTSCSPISHVLVIHLPFPGPVSLSPKTEGGQNTF